jgi:hypothetical protein
MRARLRPVIEPEHGGNDAMEFVGQMNRSDPAAIGSAGMLELLELHTKGIIELSHGAGEHDVPPAWVLVDNGKTVLVCELLDGLDIGRVRPELLVVLLMAHVTLGLVAGGDFPDPFLQRIMLAMAQDQGDFQPLRRIGFSDRTCTGQWSPLTTSKRIVWHSSTLLSLLTHAAQDLRTALQRHEAAAGPKLGFSVTLVCQAGITQTAHAD